MNSKIIFAALAMVLGTTFVAHADGNYRRPAPAPVQDDRYDDQDLDDDYYRPSQSRGPGPVGPAGPIGGCNTCGPMPPRPRSEFYCNRPNCQAPPIMPYPAPIYVPVPAPRVLGGVCTVVPAQWGWSILMNGTLTVQRGSRYEAQFLPSIRMNLINNGTCRVFAN